MKVRAVIDFRDRENGLKLRKKGAAFEANEERARRLLNFGYVEAEEENASSGKDKDV